jgi:hypothetical protein
MLPYETIHVRIDDETIAVGDPSTIVEPVWWSATIYDGPKEYERSLRPFSLPQRHIFAILWYDSEVNNGGHNQFYSNSTGIVWKDAIDGLISIGAPQVANVLLRSAQRLGGSPSLDLNVRAKELEQFNPEFNDLDDLYYSLVEQLNLYDLMTKYIRSRPADFYFDGDIRRAVLPGN